MPTAVTPFLMFEGQAEAAMTFYAGLFAGAEILRLERFGPGGPGPEGQVSAGAMLIGGREHRFFDSPAHHAFAFTPSLSLFVDCTDEAEIDRLWAGLSEGGTALMPLGAYGFSQKFGWLLPPRPRAAAPSRSSPTRTPARPP